MLGQKSVDMDKIVPSASRLPELAIGRSSPQPLVRIHVLGSMRATSYLGENVLPRGRKARAVLGYLCLHAGQHVARSRLGSLLWDRVVDSQARASCRQALRELSVAMGPLARELIDPALDTVRLDPRLCWIDALAVLSSEPLPAQSYRGDLASMCTGELLEDLSGTSNAFDEWLLAQRTRFTEQVRLLFESELKQLRESDAPPDRRAELARRVIAFDPTHEGASRVLMRALADMGERAQALREYERCRAALKASMDVHPSSETRGLYQALKMFSAEGREGSEGIQHQYEPTKPHADRLRIGVLPLQAASAPGFGSLAFSLSREIAAGLARFRWFDVIAPTSATITNGSALSRKPLHYIVEGQLSGNEEKYRISIRLMDVTDDPRPVWSDHFELAGDALDDVNELVVSPVVARIDPVILFIEGQQQRPKRSGATALVLQAMPLMYSLEREKYEEAGRLITKAIEADPLNAKAAAWGAFWQVWYVGQGWAPDTRSAFTTAQALALQAIKLDPENAEALGIYAHICAFLNRDFDAAVHYFDRALRLNPNLAFIWALSAPTYCYIGEPEQALRRLERYRDLAPFDPYFPYWEVLYTIAYTFKGEYERAVAVGTRNVAANPDFVNAYKPLIAALGHLGRSDDAKPYISKLLALEPTFTVERFGKVYPIRKPEDRDRYMRGLLLAGVPEA
jgi:DNA-binding SARP family transcriptional activator/TolB-like protein